MRWNRILSGLLTAIYVVGGFLFGGVEMGLKVVAFVVLPLACIWLSEPMGGYVGPTPRGNITAPTPGLFVCIGGWLLLLVPVIIAVVHAIARD